MTSSSKIILLSIGFILVISAGILNHSKIKELLYPWSCPLEGITQLDVLDSTLLDNGKNILSQQKAIICGISRDNANDFFVMKRHIEFLGSQLDDYRVVIVENDSKDRTKELLKKWATDNPRVTIISKDFHNKKRPSMQFLADVRNMYIDEVNQSKYDEFNLLIVIDMDMSYGFDIRGIYHSFATFDTWDAIASNGVSNQKGEMYDAFAFRNAEFLFAHYDKPKTYWPEIIPKIQRAYLVNTPLVVVDSAFGGLAIYKRKKLNACKYASIKEDCEHIEFHKCLKQNGGKMFMSPSQLIRYSHYK
jgi:hypothetical protein